MTTAPGLSPGRIALAVVGLLVLPLAPAHADSWVDVYSYDFGATASDHFAGTDGWSAGFDEDDWATGWFPDEVNPRTDDGGGFWSDPDAIANHLTQEGAGPWADSALEVSAAIFDDDALGVIVRKSAHDTFYLFFMTLDLAPPHGSGGNSMTGAGSYLYRVEDGIAELAVANTDFSARFFVDDGNPPNLQRLRLEAVGDTLRAYYDDDLDGAWEEPVLTFTDPAPLAAGHVAVYSYQMGEWEGLLGFVGPQVQAADSDEDGWINDEDCQPFDPAVNPDAAELCDDDLDNDCDGLIDASDPDCAGGDDDDSAAGDDDDDSANDGGFTLVQTVEECSCSASGRAATATWLGMVLLGTALVARRHVAR